MIKHIARCAGRGVKVVADPLPRRKSRKRVARPRQDALSSGLTGRWHAALRRGTGNVFEVRKAIHEECVRPLTAPRSASELPKQSCRTSCNVSFP
jgi:hypothetical protein